MIYWMLESFLLGGKMETKLVAIASLIHDPQNARKHTKKNLDALVQSLEKFGQRKPIVVHRGVVIAGNGMMEAAKSINWKEITVTEVPDDWDDTKAKAYAIADNRTAELAEWDNDILAETLIELQDEGWLLDDLGFPEKEPDLTPDDTSAQDIGERYEVVIECANEDEQVALLLRLSNEGLKVKALVL